MKYLIIPLRFENVIRYLPELKNIIVLNGSRLIIPLHKDAIAGKEFSILEKEFQIFT
jgi:hypothetical protein